MTLVSNRESQEGFTDSCLGEEIHGAMTVAVQGVPGLVLSEAFTDKQGTSIVNVLLDDDRCRKLIEMYLAFEPKRCFQGLPPIRDDACIEWVQRLIRNGINLVSLSPDDEVCGHVSLLPINDLLCEMLLVVSPQWQNRGIGTAITRSATRLAGNLGFERIWLPVEARNARARAVYKKCGFKYLDYRHAGEVEMEARLNSVSGILSDAPAVRPR